MLAEHNQGKHLQPGVGYVRGKLALRVLLTSIGKDIKCPFCHAYTNTLKPTRVCEGCKRTWFQKHNGDYVFVE